jgi:hypothetical protein
MLRLLGAIAPQVEGNAGKQRDARAAAFLVEEGNVPAPQRLQGRRALRRAAGCGEGPVLLDEFLRDRIEVQLELAQDLRRKTTSDFPISPGRGGNIPP